MAILNYDFNYDVILAISDRQFETMYDRKGFSSLQTSPRPISEAMPH